MRTCGACRKPLRWDEGLASCYCSHAPGGPGNYKVCPRCLAREHGTDAPPPAKYPPGEVPMHPTRDDYLPVCGLCRECLHEGERNRRIRVAEEDLGGDPVEPGAYWACPRCVERYRPAVHARLVRDGVIDTPIESFGGNAMV